MIIVEPSVEILTSQEELNQILKKIEVTARTCYKSEHCIKVGSAEKLVSNLIAAGHDAMLEHASISARFICDRGVSHELVRHRMASYAQESTRYCNYTQGKFNGELTFVKPHWIKKSVDKLMDDFAEGELIDDPSYVFLSDCMDSERNYYELVEINGLMPQDARGCLNHWVKTEVVMTANIREWRHFFKLRCDRAAHPDMRRLALMALKKFKEAVPVVFDDIPGQEEGDWENWKNSLQILTSLKKEDQNNG